MGSEEKEERCKESLDLFRENINNHKLTVGRNVNGKGHFMRSQTEMRNVLLETRGKAILVIKWQKTWMDCACALVFVEDRTNKQ